VGRCLADESPPPLPPAVGTESVVVVAGVGARNGDRNVARVRVFAVALAAVGAAASAALWGGGVSGADASTSSTSARGWGVRIGPDAGSGIGSGVGSDGASDGGSVVPEGVFWVDPESSAARQAAEWRRTGRADDALLMERIATRPQAEWLIGPGPRPVVEARTTAAAREGRTAVLVAYYIPDRDCGSYSGGGARSAAEYREWVDEFAAGLGGRGAYVIVEPDAVAHAVSGCGRVVPEERYALLAYAVDRFKQQANTRVYLDAGNPDWITDPASRGTWANTPAGNVDVHSPEAFAPVGRLAFATADVAAQYSGSCEGALVSGRDAAASITAMLS